MPVAILPPISISTGNAIIWTAWRSTIQNKSPHILVHTSMKVMMWCWSSCLRSAQSNCGKIIKTNKSISVAWSRIAVDHLALNPHQQLHYNHLDSKQLSWSKQICSSSNGGKARVWLSRDVCAAHIDENHLCASDVCTSFVCKLCASIECKFCLQVRPVWFPCEVCADSETSRRRDPRGNATLRKWSPFSGATTSIQWQGLCVCTNVNVVYSSCVGQMYPRITNLSDSKHALVDV